MALKDKIREQLVPKEETILESNLSRVEALLQIHQDGTIHIADEYRDANAEVRMLIYLIGQRFALEGGLSETDTVETDFFYDLFDRSDRTVRNDLQKLRKAGLATKEGQSKHRIVVENLPTALDTIENSSVSGD